MTFSSILPYLLVIGGYLARHYDVLGKMLSLVGLAAGPNPADVASGKPSTVAAGNHPVLSDAVNAAIKQAVADVTAGHIASLKDELKAVAKAAADAAVADIKAKV